MVKKESGIRIQRFRGPEDTVGGRVAATTIMKTRGVDEGEHLSVVTHAIPDCPGERRHYYATSVIFHPTIGKDGKLPESNPEIISLTDSGTNKRDAKIQHTRITREVARALVAII